MCTFFDNKTTNRQRMLTFSDLGLPFLVAFLHAAVGGIDTTGMLNIYIIQITQTSIQELLCTHTHTLKHKVQQSVIYRGNICRLKSVFTNRAMQSCVFQWMVPTIQNSMKPFQVCTNTHTHPHKRRALFILFCM